MNLTAPEIVTKVLLAMKDMAKPGVITKDIDLMAERMIINLGGVAINKGYKPQGFKTAYPFATCIGVNECVTHGFPLDYTLKIGDLVSFDVGVKKDGTCGDAAFTVGIGEISAADKRLLRVGRECLENGLKEVRHGAPIKEIGYAMESTALRQGYVTNRTYVGHRIGEEMHLNPPIPAFFNDENIDELSEGMMICLEPMVTKKDRWGVQLNEWVCVTKDGKKSVLFEKQVLVTKNGYEILTPWD